MGNTSRTTGADQSVKTQLMQISHLSRRNRKLRFSSLYHYLNEEMLRDCFHGVRKSRAAGIDEQTKEEYGRNLDTNIQSLVERLKKGRYRVKAVRRVQIPKPGNRGHRPLGIPTVEDCIVQEGLRRILEAIFEPMFLDLSHGFRPRRSCHTALKRVSEINRKAGRRVVEVDIQSFFDKVDHNHLLKFVAYRVSDPRVLTLVQKILRSGYIESERWHPTTEGLPQGGVVSPLLANIYLHFVFDLWFEKRLKQFFPKTEAVRYADDIVIFSEYPSGMDTLLGKLKERMGQFCLSLSPDKTRITSFGVTEAWLKGVKGCEAFDFLGFTHFIRKTYTGKHFVCRKTSRKSFTAGLHNLKQWLRENRSRLPTRDLLERARQHLAGHFEYFGVTDNGDHLSRYAVAVRYVLYHWFNKRSQRRNFTWTDLARVWDPIAPRWSIKVNLRAG